MTLPGTIPFFMAAHHAGAASASDVPDNALILNGAYLQLNGKFLVLGT